MSETMLCLKDFEKHARKVMDQRAWNFFCQGAEREQTLRENEMSYKRFRLIPRMLRNTKERDLSVTVLGEKLALPVAIAPAAYQKVAHPDGEVGAARAAAKMGTLYTLSSMSNYSLEEVAQCSSRSPKWMQVYVLKKRIETEQMILRAEASGYKALVLTVDTPVEGVRLRVKRSGYILPDHLSTPNIGESATTATTYRNVVTLPHMCDTLTWDDVKWIKRISKLPIVLKGILTAEDAVLAAEHGAAAVWVSNHGGRQLDGVDTAIDVLEDITKALKDTNCEVYADGGIRWGTDVMKLLAMGARAVFIGRPTLWGLAHSGEDGVLRVLEILRNELDKAMHLAGCRNISEIGPHILKKSPLSKI